METTWKLRVLCEQDQTTTTQVFDREVDAREQYDMYVLSRIPGVVTLAKEIRKVVSVDTIASHVQATN